MARRQRENALLDKSEPYSCLDLIFRRHYKITQSEILFKVHLHSSQDEGLVYETCVKITLRDSTPLPTSQEENQTEPHLQARYTMART